MEDRQCRVNISVQEGWAHREGACETLRLELSKIYNPAVPDHGPHSKARDSRKDLRGLLRETNGGKELRGLT